MKKTILCASLLTLALALPAAEYHVAPAGSNDNAGSQAAPFKTISAAAEKAQPGDTITVHAGVYRERVNPPRGGTADANRITYQAAPGEKVTITGSDATKGWEKVQNDTWKLTLPNSYFGKFNPFAEKVYGDWFSSHGRIHRRGCVYLNNDWLAEAGNLDAVMQPAGKSPLWFSQVDGAMTTVDVPEYLLNITWFQPAGGAKILADKPAAREGTQNAPCTDGGQCVGFIRNGNWLRFDGIDFSAGTESVDFRAAATVGTGGQIELRLDKADGDLLGTCNVSVTGDWQKW